MFTVHASGLASDCGYLSVHKRERLQTQMLHVLRERGSAGGTGGNLGRKKKKNGLDLEGMISRPVLKGKNKSKRETHMLNGCL